MLDLASGLRASKKRRTFEDILANGVALFREQGFRRTRTDQIAKASSVSAATLFNYCFYWPITFAVSLGAAALGTRLLGNRGLTLMGCALIGSCIGFSIAPAAWASMWSDAFESIVILLDGGAAGALAGASFWMVSSPARSINTK